MTIMTPNDYKKIIDKKYPEFYSELSEENKNAYLFLVRPKDKNVMGSFQIYVDRKTGIFKYYPPLTELSEIE